MEGCRWQAKAGEVMRGSYLWRQGVAHVVSMLERHSRETRQECIDNLLDNLDKAGRPPDFVEGVRWACYNITSTPPELKLS